MALTWDYRIQFAGWPQGGYKSRLGVYPEASTKMLLCPTGGTVEPSQNMWDDLTCPAHLFKSFHQLGPFGQNVKQFDYVSIMVMMITYLNDTFVEEGEMVFRK